MPPEGCDFCGAEQHLSCDNCGREATIADRVCPHCRHLVCEIEAMAVGDDRERRGLPRQPGAVWAADLVRDLRDDSGKLDTVIGKAIDDARTVGAGEIATTRAVRKALADHFEAAALSPGDQDA